MKNKKRVNNLYLYPLILFIGACNYKSEDLIKIISFEQKKEKNEILVESTQQAYALGAKFGRLVNEYLQEQIEAGNDLNTNYIFEGFRDVLKENNSMNESNTNVIIDNMTKNTNKMIQRRFLHQKMESNKKFLERNARRENVHVDSSGVQYEVIVEGKGNKPAAGDLVKVRYTGYLIDGTEFDRSIDPEGTSISLNNVINGWQVGLKYMREGGKYKLVVPYELNYGKKYINKIPPYSILIFEIELLKVRSPTLQSYN